MSYSYIQRASQGDKEIFQEIINSLNELAPESLETIGILSIYSLERDSKGFYGIKADFSDNSEPDRASLIRCKKCNDIRELFDGQGEHCLGCGQEW